MVRIDNCKIATNLVFTGTTFTYKETPLTIIVHKKSGNMKNEAYSAV